jgi:hypothetical protein
MSFQTFSRKLTVARQTFTKKTAISVHDRNILEQILYVIAFPILYCPLLEYPSSQSISGQSSCTILPTNIILTNPIILKFLDEIASYCRNLVQSQNRASVKNTFIILIQQDLMDVPQSVLLDVTQLTVVVCTRCCGYLSNFSNLVEKNDILYNTVLVFIGLLKVAIMACEPKSSGRIFAHEFFLVGFKNVYERFGNLDRESNRSIISLNTMFNLRDGLLDTILFHVYSQEYIYSGLVDLKFQIDNLNDASSPLGLNPSNYLTLSDFESHLHTRVSFLSGLVRSYLLAHPKAMALVFLEFNVGV